MNSNSIMHFFSVVILLTLFAIGACDASDSPKLLLGNRINIQLLETGNLSSFELLVDDIDYTMSCDYIYSDNLIFWVDDTNDEEKIQSVYTNVSYENRVKQDVVSTGLVQPDGLACDWIGKKIYWTDAEADHIEVSELDGKARTVLIWDQLDQPRAIAVDPLNGYMYWTDWGENPKIERAGMDGSNRKALVERDGIYWPNGLTIDYEEGKVYWVDANYHYINRMNTDGSGREVVVSNGPSNAGDNTGNFDADGGTALLQTPFSITLSGNRMYWTDWATNSIYSALKNGSDQRTVIKSDSSLALHDIHSYGPDRQKQGDNPCGLNNGGCSHLCLISPVSPYYSCACPTGVVLKEDGKTCKDGPEHILLLARRPDLRVISLDTPDFTASVLPFQHITLSVAVDYDPVDDMVYWSSNNDKEGAIYRSKLDGSNEERIISDEVQQCDGVAIDWVARNIYWSEAERHYIAVARLDGSSRKVIIEEGIVSPRAIVLDPAEGQMYWSDWGKPKIERASLDGTDRRVFVNTSIHWPNGLAIDYKRRLLYWAEAYLDTIEVIGLNGSNRRVLLKEKIPHLFGFSYLDGYLYWTDWEKRKVERMLVGDKKSRHSMIDELPDLMGIKASSVDPIPARNPCQESNGGCSHLCLYTPHGVRCNCPDGQELLTDMKNCIEPEGFLLFTLSADGVHRISLGTAPSASVEVPLKPDIDATILDIYVEENTVFWTDSEQKTIFRANMNGTDVTRIVWVGVGTLEGIAVDWIGKNIYWTDSDSNRIEMARLDGSSRMPVVQQDLHTPSSLTVDPVNGYIYWSDWGGGRPKLRRAEMDGSHVTTIIGNGEVGRANSLAIDFECMRLYWVDLDANEIGSSNMTGGDRKHIIGDDEKTFFAIALYHDYIFWTRGSVIERANKTDGSDSIRIQNHMPGPTINDMLVYHRSRQMGVSACSHGNGGCEHICLTAPGGERKCACPAQYKLKKDNVSCVAPNEFLLYAEEDEISRIVFDHGATGRLSPDSVLSVNNTKDVKSIAYDSMENYIIWIDCNGMHKSRMNGTQYSLLLERNRSSVEPFDLVVDPYNRMLYWTNSANDAISAMRLNGTIVGKILESPVPLVDDMPSTKKTVVRPRHIAISPNTAKLFFSNTCNGDHSCKESILSSFVDGSDVMILYDVKLKKVSGITVDEDKGRLYWSDQSLNVIESCMLDGSDRRVFVSDVKEPHSLTIFGSSIYWVVEASDKNLVSLWHIEAARKTDNQKGGQHKVVKGLSHDIKALVGVESFNKRNLDYHRCAKKNGGCSHLCVGKEDGTLTCSCPTHLTKINERECNNPPTCTMHHFPCHKEINICLPRNWVCDGDDDCEDAADEHGCPSCQAKDRYLCGTGMDKDSDSTARDVGKFFNVIQDIKMPQQCIDRSLLCDGSKDCLDGSDEVHCNCYNHEFTCATGACIPYELKCNTHDNCGDNSDEEDCTISVEEDPKEGESENKTLTIAIICSISCITIIVVVVVISCRRKKPQSGVTVGTTYTKDDGGRIQLQFKITHGNGDVDQQRARPAKYNSAGRSTASVNVSVTADQSGIIPSDMVHPHGDVAAHPYYGSISYRPDSHGVVMPHLPRPNVPGASSSTSSGRGRKHFLPTLNPPPSPATDRSGSKFAGDGYYSSDSQSTRTGHCYKCRGGHRHRRVRPTPAYFPIPHPTPCQSDSYDDCPSYSGTSVHEMDSISWRNKAAGAPASPPPPYCHCCHHVYHPTYLGCNAPYHPYAMSSCHSSHHGYHTPTMPHDPHHHSSSSSGSTHFVHQDCTGMCCNRSGGRIYRVNNRKRWAGLSSQRPPPCFNYEMNSDSDPFAPPPTPRSQYLSDYCCTHDEAEENQDDERLPQEKEEIIINDCVNVDTNKNPENDSKTELAPPEAEDEKIDEDQPLLSSTESTPNSPEIDFPILNPPPSPVLELS